MEPFRVALSGDFRQPDGSPTFPSFDLAPLTGNRNVDMIWVDAVDGVIPAEGLADCDALILLAAKVTADSLSAHDRLAAVARFGVGYDNVDVEACSANNVAVIITPDGVRRPVAVSIITYVLALSQKLLIKDRICREGPSGWDKRAAYMGEGLVGKTFGQLGMGNIGAEAFRMVAPFGMRLIAHDPYADKKLASDLGIELVSPEVLFREADFLSVSVPLSDATHHYVNAERLAQMKPTAFLINTARGPIVDQVALYNALVDGTIAGAGLDVFEIEPAPADEPILKLENVIVTPHALCWTDECFAGNGAADVTAVFDIMNGRQPRGIVNREITGDAKWLAKLEEFGRRFA
ncbi:MAG TPA: NAD(P)-dependent oxidoreductase [Afifellaceae bacterium]|nr:NAD(P)-dependent oxidoreductase [Afifellaceae bacterium]